MYLHILRIQGVKNKVGEVDDIYKMMPIFQINIQTLTIESSFYITLHKIFHLVKFAQ